MAIRCAAIGAASSVVTYSLLHFTHMNPFSMDGDDVEPKSAQNQTVAKWDSNWDM